MIELAVKVAFWSIPQELAIDEDKNELEESEIDYVSSTGNMIAQISKSQYLHKIYNGLADVSPISIFGFTLDFDSSSYLHEMLILSVKISFAGDEIDEKEECERILDRIWSMMCHKHTLIKIYSFLLFMKYKLQNKVS